MLMLCGTVDVFATVSFIDSRYTDFEVNPTSGTVANWLENELKTHRDTFIILKRLCTKTHKDTDNFLVTVGGESSKHL
jgi:hypothetical protein